MDQRIAAPTGSLFLTKESRRKVLRRRLSPCLGYQVGWRRVSEGPPSLLPYRDLCHVVRHHTFSVPTSNGQLVRSC